VAADKFSIAPIDANLMYTACILLHQRAAVFRHNCYTPRSTSRHISAKIIAWDLHRL